jgi:hypothetical protein
LNTQSKLPADETIYFLDKIGKYGVKSLYSERLLLQKIEIHPYEKQLPKVALLLSDDRFVGVGR